MCLSTIILTNLTTFLSSHDPDSSGGRSSRTAVHQRRDNQPQLHENRETSPGPSFSVPTRLTRSSRFSRTHRASSSAPAARDEGENDSTRPTDSSAATSQDGRWERPGRFLFTPGPSRRASFRRRARWTRKRRPSTGLLSNRAPLFQVSSRNSVFFNEGPPFCGLLLTSMTFAVRDR
jgi:hypothetical protein